MTYYLPRYALPQTSLTFLPTEFEYLFDRVVFYVLTSAQYRMASTGRILCCTLHSSIPLLIEVVSHAAFLSQRQQARCLTLPDFYGKAFGPAVEVVVSLLT